MAEQNLTIVFEIETSPSWFVLRFRHFHLYCSAIRHLLRSGPLSLMLALFSAQNDAYVLAARAARNDALCVLHRTVHTDPSKKSASALARHEDMATLRATAKAYQARKRVSRKLSALRALVFVAVFISSLCTIAAEMLRRTSFSLH